MCKDVHSWACFRFIFSCLLVSTPSIFKRLTERLFSKTTASLFCDSDLLLVCCDDPSFKINCGKFWKNFPRKECNRYNSFRAVAPIRLRLVCLGLLSPDGYGCPKSLRFQRACLRLGHGILLPRLKGLRCGLGQYGYYLSKSV